MLSRLSSWAAARTPLRQSERRLFPLGSQPSLARRLLHFWLVWSCLLLVHELGHAYVASRHGASVTRVTVGAGPVLWRTQVGATEGVLRLVPLAGMTTTSNDHGATHADDIRVLSGGVLATILFGVLFSAIVLMVERSTRHRWLRGRHVVADAVVITLLNFLPVPPLDGGRALLSVAAAVHGSALSSDALLWLQVVGFALAIVPVAIWTRWTEPIDLIASRLFVPARPR